MSQTTIFSVIESPTHPYFTALYQKSGIEELRFKSMRKLLNKIKNTQPDFIAVEFFYGYGNNYAGVNISNLDVMLYALQRYSPDTKVIVYVDKNEREYVGQLNDILPLYAVFTRPFNEAEITKALQLD